MKYQFVISGNNDATMGTTTHEHETFIKRNRCVIFPSNVSMVAESVERRNHTWFVRTKVASDLMVQVGENSFHLHKLLRFNHQEIVSESQKNCDSHGLWRWNEGSLPMVSKSEYLNRLVFNRSCRGTNQSVQIDNLPGGSEAFEVVVKFCYGLKVDLKPSNIAPLYCAAHFLEMSDDLERGNLLSKTETFLSFVIFSSWKDTFRILRSCESISRWARELQILKRCSEAIAWKISGTKVLTFDENEKECVSILPENVKKSISKKVVESWWFKDVSFLRIDHFVEVIESSKRKEMRPELVGSCIAHWTEKWLSRITFGLGNLTLKDLVLKVQRVTIESLIRLLPVEENSISCNFLLRLLSVGLSLEIKTELTNKLEKRTAFMLEKCRAKDLLVVNFGHGDTVYDYGIVAKVCEAYVCFVPVECESRMCIVGRLVDEYLMLVARIENVPARDFQLLVEALPKNARYCYDNLYRAIDMYLKAHPSLTEEERSSICRAMEYHKLSKEGRTHAMKNDRLPTDISTRFILIEQINMTKSITSVGSNYLRTKSQAILRVSKSLGKVSMNPQKEIKMMKQDVETMKIQLNKLHFCRMDLQRQVKKSVI